MMVPTRLLDRLLLKRLWVVVVPLISPERMGYVLALRRGLVGGSCHLVCSTLLGVRSDGVGLQVLVRRVLVVKVCL